MIRETPCSAIDEEKTVIGAAIVYYECAQELITRLPPQVFVDDLHRKIVDEARRQWGVDQTFDPLRIGKALRGKVQDFDPVDYLADLAVRVRDAGTQSTFFHSRADAILKAAAKRRLHSIADAATEAALNGHDPDDIYRGMVADLDDYRRDVQSIKPQFPLVSALELATARFALDYLIDRVLVEKQPCVLGGPKKSLKTTIAVLLGIHIATGISLFDKFHVRQRSRVLIASAESGLETIKETAIRICDSLGVDFAAIDNLVFTANVPKPQDPANWAAFRAAVEESGAEVLILDPFYRMIPGDGAESIFKMGVVLGMIDDLCQELQITLVLCHHLKTSRLNQFAPAELDDLAYAGCAEFFRQWILLSRRQAYQPGTGQHALWMTIGGSAGHNSLWALDIDEGHSDAIGGRHWAFNLKKPDEAREREEQTKADAKALKAQQKDEADRKAIARFLAKHPEGVSMTSCRDLCGVSGRRFKAVLASMYDDEVVLDCKIKIGTKKTLQPGIKLNPEV